MPRVKRLHPGADWNELSTTAADWKAADPTLLATMLGQLHLIRAFEETVLELAGEGLVHGPAHSSIGQEGGAVGSIVELRSTDAVNGSHRGHHQFLAKALTHVTKGVLDLAAWSHRRSPRCCSARSRRSSAWPRATAAAAAAPCTCSGSRRARSAPTPSSAAACRWRRATPGRRSTPAPTDLTVTYFGDGAANIGSVLETLNLASAWKLPLCFFIENNGYAVSTTVAEATGEPRLSARALGFGIPAWRVDGMDPLAVHLAMERAAAAAARRARARSSSRRSSTASSTRTARTRAARSATGPRRKRRTWRARDPLDRVAARDDQARADRRGRRRGRARPGRRGDARGRRRAHRAGPRTARPGARGGSARNCGRTRPSSTWASAATCPSWRGRGPSSAGLHRRAQARQVHRGSGGGDGPADGRGPAHRGARRGRAPAERRHQRRHQGPGREVPWPRARHPDQRERVRRARRRARARRPVPPGRRVHVPGLPVGRRRPGVQPDRQGQAHVRRQEPGAARAADQGRHGLRLRVAAPDGPGRHLRHQPRLADHGRLDPVRLRRADERRAGDRRPGAHARARRPVRRRGRDPGRRPRLPDPVRHGRGPARRVGRHGAQLPVHGGARAGGDRADRHRRRTHRPALPRPRLARLGDGRRAASGRPTRC